MPIACRVGRKNANFRTPARGRRATQVGGWELLFHTYIDRFTFAEITHNTAAHKYDSIIYLDERVTNEEKRANAAATRKAFDAWLEENGLTADPTALTEVPDPCEGRFDTLAGAIAHIDHILHFPDLLLI